MYDCLSLECLECWSGAPPSHSHPADACHNPMPSSSWIAFAVAYACEAVNQLCNVHKVLLSIVFPCQACVD